MKEFVARTTAGSLPNSLTIHELRKIAYEERLLKKYRRRP